MLNTLLILAIVAAVPSFAQFSGSCPDHTPVPKLNTTAFAGVWFDQAHTKRGTGLHLTCDQVKFTTETPTTMTFASFSFSGTTKTTISAIGNAHLIQPDACGVLSGSIPELHIIGEFRVLATDYSSFAVLWGCKNTTSGHADRTLILTRDKHPSSSLMTAAKKVLQNNNISQSDLNEGAQHKCPEYSFKPIDGSKLLGGSTSMGWLLSAQAN